MPLCALAVHQLRYHLAFGSQARARLGHDGHAYLSAAEPFVLLAATLAVGLFVGRLARSWQGDTEPAPPNRILRVWALCAFTLFALYCAQELGEGLFAAGHPAGIAGILGHGGWISAPLAIGVGAGLAAALRVAERLTWRAGRRSLSAAPGTSPHSVLRVKRSRAVDWRLEPQAGVTAGRSPPLPHART